MMTLIQLDCFVAVAEELHFGAAAERLKMTQPPLSRQIQLLERELGVLLFERTSRRVRLSPAGDALLPHARRILQLTCRARGAVRAVADGRGGSVTLSYTSLAAQSVLAPMLRAIDLELPDISLELREHVTVEQVALLQSGGVDLALLRPTSHAEGISFQRIKTERMVAVLPADHPIAGAPAIGVTDLADTPLIGYASVEARYLADLVSRVLLASGSTYAPVHTAGQVGTVLALVAAGLGYAIVPESAAVLRTAGVSFVPLDVPDAEGRLAEAQLDVAWRIGALSPAAERVREVLSYFASAPDAESV